MRRAAHEGRKRAAGKALLIAGMTAVAPDVKRRRYYIHMRKRRQDGEMFGFVRVSSTSILEKVRRKYGARTHSALRAFTFTPPPDSKPTSTPQHQTIPYQNRPDPSRTYTSQASTTLNNNNNNPTKCSPPNPILPRNPPHPLPRPSTRPPYSSV